MAMAAAAKEQWAVAKQRSGGGAAGGDRGVLYVACLYFLLVLEVLMWAFRGILVDLGYVHR